MSWAYLPAPPTIAEFDGRCLVDVLDVNRIGVERVQLLVQHNRQDSIAVMGLDNAARGRNLILLELIAQRRRPVMAVMDNLNVKKAHR